MKFLSFLAMTLGFMAVTASEDKFVFERLDKNDAMLAHAALGKVFDLPVILTTSAENGPNSPLPKEILEMHPDAPLMQRQGEVNAWDNQEFRDTIKAANKS
ncbi:hypothetical protein NW759_016339 [Fusarium solani]|nr:hypothetical protein NW759_016339 [Fusarium solani]